MVTQFHATIFSRSSSRSELPLISADSAGGLTLKIGGLAGARVGGPHEHRRAPGARPELEPLKISNWFQIWSGQHKKKKSLAAG